MFILSFMDIILSVEFENYIYKRCGFAVRYISYVDDFNRLIEESKTFDFYIPLFVL